MKKLTLLCAVTMCAQGAFAQEMKALDQLKATAGENAAVVSAPQAKPVLVSANAAAPLPVAGKIEGKSDVYALNELTGIIASVLEREHASACDDDELLEIDTRGNLICKDSETDRVYWTLSNKDLKGSRFRIMRAGADYYLVNTDLLPPLTSGKTSWTRDDLSKSHAALTYSNTFSICDHTGTDVSGVDVPTRLCQANAKANGILILHGDQR